MAKSYTQILTSETWRAETVLLWKLPRCSWTCLQQIQWKVVFVWIGMKTKHYDFYSSKSSCKIKTETDYFWYKACKGSQVFGRTHEEHNGEKIQIPTNSRQWAEPLFSIWNLNVIIRSYYICSSYRMSVFIWVQSTDWEDKALKQFNKIRLNIQIAMENVRSLQGRIFPCWKTKLSTVIY